MGVLTSWRILVGESFGRRGSAAPTMIGCSAACILESSIAALLSQRMNGDTSPRLGCCKVPGGSCGGNLLRV